MTFDPIKALAQQKLRFEGLRGRECRSTGCFPLTTNKDVYTFGKEWIRRTAIDTSRGTAEKALIGVSTWFGGEMPSTDFQDQLYLLKKYMPSFITALGAPNDVFQFNALFWPQVSKYTIARNAQAGLPGTWDMMGEAVEETLEERWNDAKDLVDAITPDINWSKVGLAALLAFAGYKALKK